MYKFEEEVPGTDISSSARESGKFGMSSGSKLTQEPHDIEDVEHGRPPSNSPFTWQAALQYAISKVRQNRLAFIIAGLVVLAVTIGLVAYFLSKGSSSGSPELRTSQDASCSPGHFRCVNGLCISKEKVCDGRQDCADREDEIACGNASKVTKHQQRCPDGQFRCPDKAESPGRCVTLERGCDFS